MKLNLMKTLRTMILAGCATLLLAAAGCDGSIKTVKTGTLQMRPDVTIEAVMNYRFSDGKWSAQEDAGRKIVCFRGKIREALHLAAIQTMIYERMSYDAYRDHYSDNGDKLTPAMREISQKISKLWEMEREVRYNNGKDWTNDVSNKIQQINNEIDSLTAKRKQMFVNEFDPTFWRTGSPVEFRWAVYPDGKRFELVSLANESWDKCPAELILELIFAK